MNHAEYEEYKGMINVHQEELVEVIILRDKEITALKKDNNSLKQALELAMKGNSRGVLDMMGEAKDENPISEILDSHIAKHSEAWEGLGHA